MTPDLRIAVVVATYNWPAALDRVLASLADQTHRAFEVIVADDGSGPETADLIERWTEQVRFPLKHVWQEDEGFRPPRSGIARWPRATATTSCSSTPTASFGPTSSRDTPRWPPRVDSSPATGCC